MLFRSRPLIRVHGQHTPAQQPSPDPACGGYGVEMGRRAANSLPKAVTSRALLATMALILASGAIGQERIQQRPPTFVDASTIVPNLIVEMRYAGSHNFVGAPVDGYEKPVCLLTWQAASALAEVARDLEPQGLAIKVFDCYRPVRAVEHFMRWARNITDVERKAEFYPEADKRNLFRDGYIATRSGHSRGSTIDIDRKSTRLNSSHRT